MSGRWAKLARRRGVALVEPCAACERPTSNWFELETGREPLRIACCDGCTDAVAAEVAAFLRGRGISVRSGGRVL